MSNDPEVKAKAADRAEELKDHLYKLAKGAERQETQLAATVAWLNREEGTPVQKVDSKVTPGSGGVVFTWLPPAE